MSDGFGLSPFGLAPFGDPAVAVAGPRGGLWLGGYLGPTTYLGPPVPLRGAVEAGSATAVRRVKSRPAARAVEVDTSRPVTRRKLRGVGQGSEADSATVTRPLKRQHIGPGRDRQRARPIRVRDPLPRAVEHDTAHPVVPSKRIRVGQAIELAAASSRFRPPAGYGEGPYGEGTYGGEADGRARTRKVRRIGPGRDRQRARPITPTT